MPHIPGCGCPAPSDSCPLDQTPPQTTIADALRAALEHGTGEPEQQTSSAGRPVALNDDHALKAIISAALGGTNQ